MTPHEMRLRDLPDDLNALSHDIVGAAIEMHSHLGPGFLEHTYRECLAHELRLRGRKATTEVDILSVDYKGLVIPRALRTDVLVDDRVIVELKCVPALEDHHEAKLLAYMRTSKSSLGFLFNCHAERIMDDDRRRAMTHS